MTNLQVTVLSHMNIPIPSSGQHPLLPSKSSATQDSSQNLLIIRSFQSNPSKKNSLIISSRDPLQAESISAISDAAQSFLCSFSDNEKLVRIDDTITISSKPAVALSVSVSSAVKLDSRQMELITRKMQRLTGFRNLKLENVLDPSLIAGFTICYGDDGSDVIDLSVKGQLASLAAHVESSEKSMADNVKNWSFPTG